MPDKLRRDDLKQFNQGGMDSMDFESGDFGTINTEGEEGEYLNFMGQGIMTAKGLQVKHLAILGTSMTDEMDEPEDEEYEKPEGAKKMMKKLMGDDDVE